MFSDRGTGRGIMKEIPANCSLCSLACPLIFKGLERGPLFTGEAILSVEWDTRPESKFGGSLCARGNALAEFVSHPKRLNYAFVLGERTSVSAGIKEIAKNLKAIKEEGGGASLGVVVGENLSNEEAGLALNFAKDILGTENIAIFAPDDAPIIRAYYEYDLSDVKPGVGKPDGENEVCLAIGDPFTEHPCVAKDVIKAKYAARGNDVIVISSEVNHTAWFASKHLMCAPGGEAAVMAGLAKIVAEKANAKLPQELLSLLGNIDWEKIEKFGGVSREDIASAAESMVKAVKGRVLVSNIFGRMGSPALVTVFAEACARSCPGEWSFEPQMVIQNSLGIFRALEMDSGAHRLEEIFGEKVKGVLILGVDIFSTYPAGIVENALREKSFMATTQQFWNQTAERANVVIPSANLIEKQGTVSISFDEDLTRDTVIGPPAGAISDGEFLRLLAKELGSELNGSPASGKVSRSGSCKGIDKEWEKYLAEVEHLVTAESVLIPYSEAVHVGDGALSRNFSWSYITCPEPELRLSKELAESLKVKAGDIVKVSSPAGEVELKATVTGKLKGKTASATIHFPEVRKLFPWKVDNELRELVLTPVSVKIEKKGKK